jgi:hypothetical protein
MRVSRRTFLSLAGITLLGSRFLPSSSILPDLTVQYARALGPLSVFETANTESPLKARLFPDSVVRVLNVEGNWSYIHAENIGYGCTSRRGLQPMLPYTQPSYITMPNRPFWTEAAAPVAAVRAWCAADAPLVTRIGHGGVLRVIDALPGDPMWYGVESPAGTLLGWTQAKLWQAAPVELFNLNDHVLEINLNASEFTVHERNEPILRAPFSAGKTITTGTYTVSRRQIGGYCFNDVDRTYYGVPWMIMFGDDYELAGIYWHHDFGTAKPGLTAQISPLVARWLYYRLPEGSRVIVY